MSKVKNIHNIVFSLELTEFFYSAFKTIKRFIMFQQILSERKLWKANLKKGQCGAVVRAADDKSKGGGPKAGLKMSYKYMYKYKSWG